MRPPRDVAIHSIDAEGNGLGKDDRGLDWRIRGAPPGSVVKAVGRPKLGYRIGLVHPPPDGLTPPCPAVGMCGGCVWQELPIERQRAEKHAAVNRLIEELGGIDHGVVGEDAAYGWRNKVELSFGVDRFLAQDERDAERVGRWLGYHPPGRFDRIVDLAGCLLVEPTLDALYRRVRADVLASGFAFWDPRTHTGFFRHLGLRTGEEGVLVTLYTAPPDDEQAAWLAARAPHWGASGVCWVVSDGRADAAVGTLRAVLHGQPTVSTHLGAVVIQLSSSAFFQVNHAAAARLAGIVAEWVGAAPVLWDLYCGSGILGLACVGRVGRVYGIERNAASIEDARATANRNGIDATFVAGEVEKLVTTLPRPDAVIVDPPRAGLHPEALRVVGGLDADVLVYVACRPSSLARDGLALRTAGWTCTDRICVDIFPQTAHIEVITRWVRTSVC